MERIRFPDPRRAADHGLVAVGGDYRPDFLLAAYSRGIFPWPYDGFPYAWFSPNPRMVLRPAELHVARSLRRVLRRGVYRVTYDTAFERVMRGCARAARPGQVGTWITDELMAGFAELHRAGFAHSVETWHGDELAGGLYGLALGAVFCGESMFFRRPDASKVALVHLVRRLERWGFRLIDCQVHTEHLARMGAREWHRDRFLDELEAAIQLPGRRGSWTEREQKPQQP